MKFQIQFRESTAAGGQWCWSLWKPIPNGRVIMTSEHGFQTRPEAKQNWKEFVAGVANAERIRE